jgi:hypothetical protein
MVKRRIRKQVQRSRLRIEVPGEPRTGMLSQEECKQIAQITGGRPFVLVYDTGYALQTVSTLPPTVLSEMLGAALDMVAVHTLQEGDAKE